MTATPIALLTDQDQELRANVAARTLGQLLFDTPEYQAFVAASDAVHDDPEAQRLSTQIGEHNSALQWGQGDATAHRSTLQQLGQELENLASVQTYHQAEQTAVRLFREVDLAVGQAAGVEFAANARRSSCGCGG